MVSVTHSVAAQSDLEHSLQTLAEGLAADDVARLRQAVDLAQAVYDDRRLGSDEGVWDHALGMALIVAGLKLDADARVAALLFAVPAWLERGVALLEADFGSGVARLVDGISRLNRLRPIARGFAAQAATSSEKNAQETKAQVEILRKMLLATVEDIRVVLLRLASRTQTLRHFAAEPDDLRVPVARETLGDGTEGRHHRALLPENASRTSSLVVRRDRRSAPSAVGRRCRRGAVSRS